MNVFVSTDQHAIYN